MATYNRGRHILPSVQSVLAQSLQNFELWVIGDHCTDGTRGALAPLIGEQVRWLNLPKRGGSQTFPNNAGIARARGRYIAYLGHDDIWAPNHLEALKRCFDQYTDAAYAVSGMVLHSPPGTDLHRVTGLFDGAGTPGADFFPPSSLAHKREVIEQIGRWRRPLELRAPVDAELQLRAVKHGLQFRSTGIVTAHKFTASQRYLSYVRHSSDEQADMLARMSSPGIAAFVDARIESARQGGGFMTLKHSDFKRYAVGEIHREIQVRKGSVVSAPKPLTGIEIVKQLPGNYALDWRFDPASGVLRAGPNPNPRYLLPFDGDGPATVLMTITHPTPDALTGLQITGPKLRGLLLSPPVQAGEHWYAAVRFRIDLRPARGAMLGFRLTEAQVATTAGATLGLGDIVLSSGAAEDEAVRLRGALQNIRQSRVWRWTAPLRALGRRLKPRR